LEKRRRVRRESAGVHGGREGGGEGWRVSEVMRAGVPAPPEEEEEEGMEEAAEELATPEMSRMWRRCSRSRAGRRRVKLVAPREMTIPDVRNGGREGAPWCWRRYTLRKRLRGEEGMEGKREGERKKG